MKTKPLLNLPPLVFACFLLFAIANSVNGQVEKAVSVVDKNIKVALKTDRVVFGEVAGANSITNVGEFTDRIKDYDVQFEKSNFYFITDGSAKGWVFKSSVSIVPSGELKGPKKGKTNNSAETKSSGTKVEIDVPNVAISKLKKIGMGVEVPWKKSEFDDYWISQLRYYNDGSGKTMTVVELMAKRSYADLLEKPTYNEICVEIFGKSAFKLQEFQITAEIYQSKYKKRSIELAVKAIRELFNDCPSDVIEAFENGKSYQNGDWRVERKHHRTGYNQILRYGGKNLVPFG